MMKKVKVSVVKILLNPENRKLIAKSKDVESTSEEASPSNSRGDIESTMQDKNVD